jgi:hypothetical protein
MDMHDPSCSDPWTSDQLALFREAAVIVRDRVRAGGRVAIACQGGKNRSATLHRLALRLLGATTSCLPSPADKDMLALADDDGVFERGNVFPQRGNGKRKRGATLRC